MELLRALGALCEPPGEEHETLAAAVGLERAPTPAEYADTFLLRLYPYASVYLGGEGMLGGEARERVAGFWTALGLVPPPEPDHAAALLALAAALADEEADAGGAARRALLVEARRALLWEHLLPWLPPYLAKAQEVAAGPYRTWAALLREALLAEADALRLVGEPLPLQLRSAPALEPPAAVGGESFLAQLLAPVRSGMLLTRDDLARAARELGLGLRAGERRFALRALLGQDAAGTLDWLAAEARRWEEGHARDEAVLGGIARFWRGRAAAAAAVLQGAAEIARTSEQARTTQQEGVHA